MNHLKITSVFLSVALCMSFVMTPVTAVADETEAPSETTETTEATETTETKETEAPKETEKVTEPTEETEPSESAPAESEREDETVPSESEPASSEEAEPSEPSETEATTPSEPSETEAEAKTEPQTDSKKSSNALAGGGPCGTNANWAYDGYGTLTITGSGAMGNYEPNGPWLQFIDGITKVVISDGITSIGKNNFKDCENLKSVTFPDSVKSIGEYAFAGCKGLTSVTLPSNLKEIASYAFKDCTGIKSLTIPGSVDTVLYGFAFDNCGITTLTISNGVRTINGSFSNCESLTTIYIPKSVASLQYSFFGSKNIKEINYSSNATDWSKISGLETNDFSKAKINYIDTFYTITVKDVSYGSITLSKYTATKGETIRITAKPDPGYYLASFKVNGVQHLGNAFSVPGEDSIVEPEFRLAASAPIGETFVDYDHHILYQVTNNATDGTGTVTCLGFVPSYPIDEAQLKISHASAVIAATVSLYGINYRVTSIKAGSFRDDKYIQTVSIGSNVAVIGDNAFYNCAGITKVTIGKGVKTIGNNAFARCPKISSFTVTSAVLYKIGTTAFYKDSKLKTLYIKYTTKLSKKGVKKSLKGSSVKTVKVKKSKVKKYKKYFTKKNCGRKVKVKK